jgi:hypothetical protein
MILFCYMDIVKPLGVSMEHHIKFDRFYNELRALIGVNTETLPSKDVAYAPESIYWKTVIDLGNSEITELPLELGLLVNLEVLGIQSSQLTEFPTVIWKLVNLRILYMSRNKLTEVLFPFRESLLCTNLQALYLDANQLIELPKEIGQLTNLQELIVSHNRLIELPTEIGA